VAAWVLLAGAAAARAQAIEPALERDIVRLMDVTGAMKVGEQLGLIVTQQMIGTMRQARPDIPPRALEIAQSVVQSTLGDATRSPGGLMSRMVRIYARHFTHDDVKGLLAFYDTPLGRKTIAVLPQIAQEGADAGSVWATEMVPKIEAEVQRRMKAEGLVK
jgi:hypothetical protein